MFNKIYQKLFRFLIRRNIFDVFLGRIFFGNDSTFIKNIQGHIVLLKNKKKVAILENKNLKVNGFEIVKDAVCRELIQNLRIKFNKEIKLKEVELKKNLRFDFSSMNNPYFFNKFHETKIIFNQKLHQILENYYSGNFEICNVHLYRILKNEKTSSKDLESYGSTISWHNDGSRADSLKIFISLEKIDEDAGPMEFINKKETKAIFKSSLFNLNKIQIAKKIESKNLIKKMTFADNEAYIINTNHCLHRAQSPIRGYRDLLVYYCRSSSNPFNGRWEEIATQQIY